MPPPLSETLASDFFKLLLNFLKSQPNTSYLYSLASKCLFQLSATNFNQVIGYVVQYISPSVTEEDINTYVILLEFINFDAKKLSNLFIIFHKTLSSMKKSGTTPSFARILRNVIWNWIDRYPREFVQLCSTKARLGNFFLLQKRTNFFYRHSGTSFPISTFFVEM